MAARTRHRDRRQELPPLIILRMHRRVRRDPPLLRQLDHVNGRRVSRCAVSGMIGILARPQVSRSACRADGGRVERDAGLSFAAMAFDLQPPVTAVEVLRDCRRWLRRAAKAFHLFRP